MADGRNSIPSGCGPAPTAASKRAAASSPHRSSPTLLFLSFLRLGLTAFGGPAMVAYIRELAVIRKRWLDERCFADGVALCQSIPGATAMQTAAYVGLRSEGLWGGLAAYLGFGLPAFVLMTVLSAVYAQTRSHHYPARLTIRAALARSTSV